MTCPMAEGAHSAIDSLREVGVEDLSWDVGSGESPKGFPHTITWGLRQIRSSTSNARTFHHHQVPWLWWRERI